MLIRKSKLSRSLTAALSVVGFTALCGNSNAQDFQRQPPVKDESAFLAEQEEMYLEVALNGVPTESLSRFVRRKGEFFASSATLSSLGFKKNLLQENSHLIPLSRFPGVQVTYGAELQRLALVAPVDLLDLPITKISAQSALEPVPNTGSRLSGLVLNYDVYAQQDHSGRSFSAFTETRLFSLDDGVWANSMVTRTVPALNHQSSLRNVRLDTSWQKDFPEQMLSLSVGDFVTGGLSWTRSTRLGGFRLSRNFALQPYRATSPLSSFSGSALLPSTVDLFINGLRQSSDQVQPGQFELSGIPSFNGRGNAQIVLTDINGQARTYSLDLYGTPQLLAEGLVDWSFELGAPRQDFGLKSFAYRDGLVSATGRYGLSNRTTIEGHAESSRAASQAGVGAVWRVGEQAGVVNASLAASRADSQAGTQWGTGYQWSSSQFTVAFNTTRRTASFKYAASLANEAQGKGSDSATLGTSGAWGSLGLNVVRQHYFDAPPAGFVNLSWSPQMPGGASLSVNLIRSFGIQNSSGSSNRLGIYAFFSIPLDKQTSLSLVAQSGANNKNLSVRASHSPSATSNDLGWNLQTGTDGGSTTAQAQVSQLGRYGQWSAGLNWNRGAGNPSAEKTIYGSVSGGMVASDGNIYASRRVDDAFAIVSTSGVPNVPVRLENRIVGETDTKGMLFVTQLNAYQRNQITIDPEKLPYDMRIRESLLNTVPEARRGVAVNFDLRRVRVAELALQDTQGIFIPPGSLVSIQSSLANTTQAKMTTVVGYDGLVFLEDAPTDSVLTVELPDKPCQVLLPTTVPTSPTGFLGTLTCR